MSAMDVPTAISCGAAILLNAGIAESRRESASLLAFVLEKQAVFLIAHPEYELTDTQTADFQKVIARRALREPFHYIVGQKEFFGLDFEVSPAVLIPRPETEILVEKAITLISQSSEPTLLEIGVGSGCISVSILHNVTNARATGVDISGAALKIADRNASRHGVADRLTLRKADIYNDLNASFDLIVSNPPYIPDSDIALLQPEVRRFEPREALAGGPNGLAIVRSIVSSAPGFLRPGGHLLIEIGFAQAESVEDLFDMNLWGTVEFLHDHQDLQRVVKAHLL